MPETYKTPDETPKSAKDELMEDAEQRAKGVFSPDIKVELRNVAVRLLTLIEQRNFLSSVEPYLASCRDFAKAKEALITLASINPKIKIFGHEVETLVPILDYEVGQFNDYANLFFDKSPIIPGSQLNLTDWFIQLRATKDVLSSKSVHASGPVPRSGEQSPDKAAKFKVPQDEKK